MKCNFCSRRMRNNQFLGAYTIVRVSLANDSLIYHKFKFPNPVCKRCIKSFYAWLKERSEIR